VLVTNQVRKVENLHFEWFNHDLKTICKPGLSLHTSQFVSDVGKFELLYLIVFNPIINYAILPIFCYMLLCHQSFFYYKAVEKIT
jgi:hypothetical protein